MPAYFWIIKGLSTAMGESTSDYLVKTLHPVPAVALGFVGFVLALSIQYRSGRTQFLRIRPRQALITNVRTASTGNAITAAQWW